MSNAGSAKQRVKRIISTPNRLIGRHLAIRLDAVLQAKEFPARISNLYAALPQQDAPRVNIRETLPSLHWSGLLDMTTNAAEQSGVRNMLLIRTSRPIHC